MRTRNIKPNFFKNEILCALNPLARILFAGLWCIADREGRLEDRPLRIKAELLPYDDCDTDALLSLLHENGFITRYSSGSEKYIEIPKFLSHQHPNIKEAASVIPPPNRDNGADKTPSEKEKEKEKEKENNESTQNAPCSHDESSPLYLKPNTLNPIPHTLNPDDPKDDDDADAVLKHFEEVTKLFFRDRKTPKALITQTLSKGFTPDELNKVTEKLNSEWKDTKYAYLLTPSYIFGDKFEELLLRQSPKAKHREKTNGNFTSYTDRDYSDEFLDSFCVG